MTTPYDNTRRSHRALGKAGQLAIEARRHASLGVRAPLLFMSSSNEELVKDAWESLLSTGTHVSPEPGFNVFFLVTGRFGSRIVLDPGQIAYLREIFSSDSHSLGDRVGIIKTLVKGAWCETCNKCAKIIPVIMRISESDDGRRLTTWKIYCPCNRIRQVKRPETN